MRTVPVALALLLVFACEPSDTSTPPNHDATPSGDVAGDGDGPDAASGDAEGGEDVAPPEPPAPSASLETALTPVGLDALLPVLGGDHLAWYTVAPVAPAKAEADTANPADPAPPEIDCLACVGCGGCEWRLMLRHLGTGEETVVATETYLQSAPRIGDGNLVRVRNDGWVEVLDLATGASTQRAPPDNHWFSVTPVPFEGALWWYGYSYQHGRNGVLRLEVDSGKLDLVLDGYLYESWTQPGGLGGLGRGQPFSIGGAGIVWVDYSGATSLVKGWDPVNEEALPTLSDPDRDFLAAVSTDHGVVTKSYMRQLGCSEALCAPELRLHVDGATRTLTDGGKPSLYGRPVAAGNRLFWFDYRSGPYAIWSRRLDVADAAPERVTSDEALVGVSVPIAASSDQLVWADRRDGRWRLYTKAL